MNSTLRRGKVLPVFLILIWGVTSPHPIHAETQLITAEASYIMGDGESPSFAEAMALQKAKQAALEQAGTYIESYTKVHNYELTTEEIQTIAGGVIAVETLEKSRTLLDGGLRFFIKIKAAVNTDKMEELAHRIKGKNVAREYSQLQQEYAQVTREIESLKHLLAKAREKYERTELLEQIGESEKVFSKIQEREITLFHRLVQGDALVALAMREKEVVDRLVQEIIGRGQMIEIGKPQATIDPEAPHKLIFRVPLTIKVAEGLIASLQSAAKSMGGELKRFDSIEPYYLSGRKVILEVLLHELSDRGNATRNDVERLLQENVDFNDLGFIDKERAKRILEEAYFAVAKRKHTFGLSSELDRFLYGADVSVFMKGGEWVRSRDGRHVFFVRDGYLFQPADKWHLNEYFLRKMDRMRLHLRFVFGDGSE